MANSTELASPCAGLTDAEIDRLIAHPFWESLGPELDALIGQMPANARRCERTTILTWVYQQGGATSFLELTERITGYGTITGRKKQLRYMVRGLERLLLVHIVNFPGREQPASADEERVLGRFSLVTLTWTGMVWMRRAWQARARLARDGVLQGVHRALIEEEDEGKANEPYWVENITGVDPEGVHRRAQHVAEALPALASVFDLARRPPP